MADIFNWQSFDLVRKHIDQARYDWRSILSDDEMCPFVKALRGRKLESPIEAVFVVWWRVLRMLSPNDPAYALKLSEQHAVTVNGQHFRLDFAVLPSDVLLAAAGERLGCPMKIAVELDGHDFHEKSKEQVAYRNQRDRSLQADGWTVLHVSGSELVKDPAERVLEVLGVGEKALRRTREALAVEWSVTLEK